MKVMAEVSSVDIDKEVQKELKKLRRQVSSLGSKNADLKAKIRDMKSVVDRAECLILACKDAGEFYTEEDLEY